MAEEHDDPQDFGKGEAGEVKRWLIELSAAETRDKKYRERSKKIWERYRGKNRRANSFNILWANTEILQPAAYNSTPKPDVRRRFKDADPVGKLAAEAQRRCLEFASDTEDFDGNIKFDVLDMLVPGRGVARVRYVPSFQQTPVDDGEPYDQIAWEQVCIEHVQWDEFRIGPGKTWRDVEWVAFHHRMKRKELVALSPEYGEKVNLDDFEDDGRDGRDDKDREVFKTCGVWEIWDKDSKQVLYVTPNERQHFLRRLEDPLSLEKFFPIPKPLYAINDSGSMDPIPLYHQYEEQAKELDRISTRINKIVDALKVRGIYDSTLTCLSNLMAGEDNDLIPAENVEKFLDKGFEGAIWMMPIEGAAKVLQALYIHRDATKAVIYELTGISDILRGASDPNETLGAQEIKAQTGSQRIQQIQRDVARYIRDLMCMMGEIIAGKFQQETLQKMTGLQIPTRDEAMQQMQQQMMQAQQSGQQMQPGQQPQMPITWEDVMALLRDDATRTFKIDIETDSTIAASIQSDMQGIEQVLSGVTQFLTGVAPLVQAGVLPMEAAKEIVMTIARRAKMGNAVEDALDQMQQPPPQPQQADPAQAQAQADQMKTQAQQQTDAAKLQAQQQADAARLQADTQIQQFKIQSEMQMHQMELQHKAQMEENKLAQEAAMLKAQSQQDAQIQLILASIQKDQATEVARINAEAQPEAMS